MALNPGLITPAISLCGVRHALPTLHPHTSRPINQISRYLFSQALPDAELRAQEGHSLHPKSDPTKNNSNTIYHIEDKEHVQQRSAALEQHYHLMHDQLFQGHRPLNFPEEKKHDPHRDTCLDHGRTGQECHPVLEEMRRSGAAFPGAKTEGQDSTDEAKISLEHNIAGSDQTYPGNPQGRTSENHLSGQWIGDQYEKQTTQAQQSKLDPHQTSLCEENGIEEHDIDGLRIPQGSLPAQHPRNRAQDEQPLRQNIHSNGNLAPVNPSSSPSSTLQPNQPNQPLPRALLPSTQPRPPGNHQPLAPHPQNTRLHLL